MSAPISCASVYHTTAATCRRQATGTLSAWQDSEIYLRRLYQSLESGGGVSGATGTPRYVPGSASAGGGSGGSVSGFLHVPVYSPINYAPPIT